MSKCFVFARVRHLGLPGRRQEPEQALAASAWNRTSSYSSAPKIYANRNVAKNYNLMEYALCS